MQDELKSIFEEENRNLIQNEKEVIKSLEFENADLDKKLFESDEFSFSSTLLKLLKIGGSMVVSFMIMEFRYILLFIFCRNYGLAQLEALAAVIPFYSTMTIFTSWSSTQGHGFKASEFAAAKEYRNLGLITNKALFFNLSIGLLMFIVIFFVGGPLFSLILNNPEADEKINTIFKFISIGTPFQFWQMVSNRYFCATMKPIPLLIGSIIGLITQVLFLLIFVHFMDLPEFGVGMAFSLGTLALVGFNIYNFIYMNPNPEAVVVFRFDETLDNIMEFIWYSIPLGLIVFLSMISLDLMPFLSLIAGQEAFAAYGAIEAILIITYTFGEAMALSNNVQLNFAKATKNFKYINTILLGTLTILSVYVLVLSIILIFLFEEIVSLFTSITSVIDIIVQMKVVFIFCQIMMTFHSTLSESISSLGNNIFPLSSLFIGRYVIVICFSFFLYHVCNLGASSVLIALLIGLTSTNIVNAVFLWFQIKEIREGKVKEFKQE